MVSRRQVIVAAGGATVVAAGGVTVIRGGNDTGNSSDSDGTTSADTTTNVIKAVEVVSGDSSTVDAALSATLLEGQADQIALLADGEQVASTEVAAAETQVTVPISGAANVIPPSTDEVVAYAEDEVIDRMDWSPTIEIGVESVTASRRLSLTLRNDGDIAVNPDQIYISGGFPTEVHGTDRVAEDAPNLTIPPLGGTSDYDLAIRGATAEHLVSSPPGGECIGETRPVEVTLGFPNTADRLITLDVTLAGEAVESSRPGDPVYCTEPSATVQSVTRNP